MTGVLLAPLPYKQADDITVLWSAWRGFDQTRLSYDEYEAYKAEIPAFANVALYGDGAANLTDGDQFDERGDGFIVQVRSSQAAPLPMRSSYTIETAVTWSGTNGRTFTSAGADLVTLDGNGAPIKAVLRSFRTICS